MLTNGKNFLQGKNPPDEFKVITLKNPLINNQAITSMRNLTTILAYSKISTYSWTFAPIPHWTWSYSSLLSFDTQISNLLLTPLHGSQYMTNSNNLNEFCWLQNSSLRKWWRSRSTWLQNPITNSFALDCKDQETLFFEFFFNFM